MQLRKKRKKEPLNIVPMLDAVFIFIFFLLTTIQFVDMRSIKTSLPMVQTVEQEKLKKEPLNLTLKVKANSIDILIGLNGRLHQRIEKSNGFYKFDDLYRAVYELKKKNPKEDSVVLKPDLKVKYREIISIIDNVKVIKDKKDYLKDKKGLNITGMFQKVSFDTGG